MLTINHYTTARCCECGTTIYQGDVRTEVNGEVFCSWECSQADPCLPRNRRIELADFAKTLAAHGVKVRA